MEQSSLNAMIWESKFETGISEIDEQHKRLLGLVNTLQSTIHENNPTMIGKVLVEMVDYTLTHFAFEEELMNESGYRFLSAHKKVHELFVKKVSEYQNRFKKGEDIAVELHKTLVRWLANHICNEDQGYVTAIKSHFNVSPEVDQSENNLHSTEESEQKGWLSRFFQRIFS